MDQPGPTKSTRNRVVGLSLTALNNLKAMFEMAIERNPEDFVFTREGTFINPEYFSKWISGPLLRRVSKNGARFHDMRHFYASMLIAQGESPKYIQDQLGACKHHHYLRHLWSPDQQVEAGSGSALGKIRFRTEC
jgi:integrase